MPAAGVLIDAGLDTHWASRDARFRRVTHVFHQEWNGIRAAAGYLPGRKVAITSARPLTEDEMRQAVDACTANLSRHVVVHSTSENMTQLIWLLRKSVGDGVRIHAIWHGSTAQFHYSGELDAFAGLLRLRKNGLLDGIACVKPGMDRLSPQVHREVLLNVPPSSIEPTTSGPTGAALIPVPNDWRKNFYTNLFAGDKVAELHELFVTITFPLPPELALRCRVVQTGSPDRWTLLRLLERMDVLLNATLSECQPMTALEALSHHVPCITGPLSLGELDRHPYQQLVQVAAVDSIEQVRARIEQVLEMRWKRRAELEAMMKDYRALLERAAHERLGEFLEL
jgi:hypothetical protein